jgi:endonuclease VIII
MPEGDTVWLAARRLDECLASDVLVEADLRIPRLSTIDLTGRRVERVRAYGKHLLFHLSGDLALHTHFRMDGAWHLYRPGRPWKGGPAWQVRAVLATEAWQAVGYRLPVVELLDPARVARLVGRLGPDVLDDAADLADMAARLREHADRAIGDALLDQSIVAGFGLIYVTETLYLRGISPFTRVGDIADVEGLVTTGRDLMRSNRGHGAQTSTGSLRDQHYVYGRAGRPCRRCGTAIRFGQQASGPYVRDAYWCPNCQPEVG